MSLEVRRRPEAISIVAGRLCLSFTWTGDRWTHRLETADGTTVLASAFESPEESTPVSPTYQDLHVESAPDRATAMALGRFGRHHYSASFILEQDPGRFQPFRIVVDVADRGPDDSPLVATYTVHRPSGAIYDVRSQGAGWSIEPLDLPNLLIERDPRDTETSVSVGAAGPAACRVQVQASPNPAGDRTRRLRYSWIIEQAHSDLEPSEP